MPQLVPLSWYHLGIFGVLVPYLSIKSHARLKATTAPLNRVAHFRTTAATLVAFGVLSLLTAWKQHLALFNLDPAGLLKGLPAAIAMYVGAVLFMKPRWRRAVEQRRRIVHLFMPENATERAWWISVSTLAGISEEITWRGVQTTLLAMIFGNVIVASLICAVMFGLGHYVQGWRSAAIIGVFALAFQAIVWLSGGLLLAMLVHIAYDITAGLNYGRLGKELGYSL